MCGRFVSHRSVDQLKRHFPIDLAACQADANYNIAPGQQVMAILREEGANVLDKFHWGYDQWLNPANTDTRVLQGILLQQTITDLVFRPVSKGVNSSRTNDPGNILPIQMELI